MQDRGSQNGALLDARLARGLTISEVARRAGISIGHLSRVERGEREATRSVLDAVAGALGMPVGELLHAAGLASPEAIALAADPACNLAFQPEEISRTRDALRRIHLGALAEDCRRRATVALGGEVRIPVDPSAMLRVMGISVFVAPGRPPVRLVNARRVEVDPAVEPAEGRYLLGHVAGHLVLDTGSCNRDLLDESEADASAFAAYLLLPAVELRRLTKSMAAGRTLRKPSDFTLIAEVAERFGVPFWMAARRAADEGIFDELAEAGD